VLARRWIKRFAFVIEIKGLVMLKDLCMLNLSLKKYKKNIEIQGKLIW
jgi:hypothetical protein